MSWASLQWLLMANADVRVFASKQVKTTPSSSLLQSGRPHQHIDWILWRGVGLRLKSFRVVTVGSRSSSSISCKSFLLLASSSSTLEVPHHLYSALMFLAHGRNFDSTHHAMSGIDSQRAALDTG